MINREELFALPVEEKRQLAAELLNSIDQNIIEQIPEWKKQLIYERLDFHNQHKTDGITWTELKKKYTS